jgi:hypothetical protein
VALVRTDISEECISSVRVDRIGEIGTMLAVTETELSSDSINCGNFLE